MKNNPFLGAQLVLQNGNPIEDLRLGTSSQHALSESTGEINAYSKADLANMIGQLMVAKNENKIVPAYQSALASSDAYRNQLDARREVLAAAFSDPAKWEALGSSIATQLQEQRARDGFMRRISAGNPLKQGEEARVTMPAHDATAVVATSASSIGYQVIRNKRFYPSEFEITANLRVEQLDIDQVSSDILEELYTQGLDAIMVQEDLIWKRSADATVSLVNPLQYITGQLTPNTLARIRQGVTRWNLPATTAIISNDFWTDVTGNVDFASFLDPINKYDLVMNGSLGTLSGMNILTDAFRQPNQKVLDAGEIYVVASPINHAAYTDRGGIRSMPTSGADAGNTTRGWLLSSPLSFVLANARSVSKGKRL